MHNYCKSQGDHSAGKHGKVAELDSGQGKVRESYNHHLAAAREKDHIISGFGIYGAAVVPDSGVGY